MRRNIASSLLFLLVLAAPAFAELSPSVTAGAEIAVGYTAIDLPTALEWDQNDFEDWDQIYGRVETHALLYRAGPVLLGASAAWNRLYYYWVRVPYGTAPLTYEGTVQPVSVGAVAQIEVIPDLLVRAGPSIMIFGDGLTVGLRASTLYSFVTFSGLTLSGGATADLIFGSGVPFGIGLVIGADYAVDLQAMD